MQFLFDNPFLIFILIGIISSLFKRGKGEQEQQPKRRPNPPVQQGQTPVERMPREPKPQRTQIPKNDSPVKNRETTVVPENPFLDIQKKYEERKRESPQKRNNPQKNTDRVQPNVLLNKEIDDSSGNVSIDLSPEADRVIEGIAWAQVLGPPRSRNPYRTDRRR